MTTENLIPLVYSKPEIWDQSSLQYTSKDMKIKAWNYIADKLDVTADVAKARWTNLRDLFRRELKKTLKMARETGDPEAYVPRWKHFKTMLFLKEQIVKDEDVELPSLSFDDTFSLYPQTILEDEGIIKVEEESFEDEFSPRSTPTSHVDMVLSSDIGAKRSSSQKGTRKKKRENQVSAVAELVEDYSSYQPSDGYNEMDEDYHFVMSILPSVRRIRPNRKTAFKMKVLQLIVDEEEKCVACE